MKYLIGSPDYGRRVEVYRNLHRDCYSIRDVKTRRVIYHSKEVYLQDVEFRVNQSGRERVLREQRKNVHATVRGIWLPELPSTNGLSSHFVFYNPYEFRSFVMPIDLGVFKEVSGAKAVLLDNTFRMRSQGTW